MRLSAVFVMAMLAAVATAPPVAAAPNESRAEYLESDGVVDCGGDVVLDVHREGWVTTRRELPGERNVAIRNFHVTQTYTNELGDTWTYRDIGHVHFFIVDGEFHAAVSGHTVDVPPFDAADPDFVDGDGNYGRWVLNQDTGEYSVVGSYRGVLDDQACEALA